jgi:UDP-N-acetylmuramoylalanine--D-glutamate ligase
MAGNGRGHALLDNLDRLRAGCTEHAQAAVNARLAPIDWTMEFSGKRVMVIGLGISGRAAARLLAARGADLVMTDMRADLSHSDLPEGEVHLGTEDPAWLAGVNLIVASPGVPPTSKLMVAARQQCIPMIGELELGSRFASAPMVAITGTNGKSTVTVMIGEILKAFGLKTFVGGNLGTPLADVVGGAYDAAVIEVSSYQLELIDTFKPRVGIHLNLTDDHLDRYRDLNEYGQAKARLFENQDGSDWAILNRDDAHVWKLARGVRSRVFSFGMERPANAVVEATRAIWCEGDWLAFTDGRGGGRIAIDGFKLPGRHNLLNAMAAAAAALAMGVATQAIERALAEITGLAHRTEFVREKDGVRYVDDSKGTNVGAVIEALAAARGPVILIAGGVDKGGDYGPLRAPLKEKVKVLILIGAAREKMRASLEGATAIEIVTTLTDAVRIAAAHARHGDTVMLSPACSSFDQFKDYAERGRVFQELVRAL